MPEIRGQDMHDRALHTIAATEYDDPSQWRRIADANGIENPLDLEPGQELLIPPILNFTT